MVVVIDAYSFPLTKQEALMRRKHKAIGQGEDLFVGIDLHKRTWHITIRTRDVQIFSGK